MRRPHRKRVRRVARKPKVKRVPRRRKLGVLFIYPMPSPIRGYEVTDVEIKAYLDYERWMMRKMGWPQNLNLLPSGDWP